MKLQTKKLNSHLRFLLFILLFSLSPLTLSAINGLILIGPPGSGKGTFAQLIISRTDIKHVSPGNLLRAEVQSNTDLGDKIKNRVEKGELITNTIVYTLVKEQLEKCLQQGCPFLLDGFPQSTDNTLSLFEFIEKHPEIDITYLLLETSSEICIDRICSRLLCKDCPAIYNRLFNPPLQENRCDYCSGKLYRRTDDQLERARKRLHAYHQKIQPVLLMLEQKGAQINIINTNQSIDHTLNLFKYFLKIEHL